MKGHDHGIRSTDFPEDHDLQILGHELGNVLNGLLGMTELLGDSGLTAEQGRWLRAITVSGKQMESLIQSVLHFDSAGQQGVAPHPERVDGIELLEQVVISHTPAARSKNNHLLLFTDPQLARYWEVDACRVRQVLDNLVGNANKFTQSGEISVWAEQAAVDGETAGAIRLRVSDTGQGFNGAVAERIFGAYHQRSSVLSAGIGNRGLGLYICRRLTKAMSGQITGASPAGGGASFEVVLPGALPLEEPGRPTLQSTLLEQVRCQLQLPGKLGLSVANCLARLGVYCSDRKEALPVEGFVLRVSELARPQSNTPHSLLFEARPDCGVSPQRKILEAPLLESTIGATLLEMVLEWRSLMLRNENPGSIPTLR